MKKVSLFPRVRLFTMEDAPATQHIFIMLAPRMLPMASSPSPFFAAITLVATSGIDVPSATRVRAITDSGILNEIAIVVAETMTNLLEIMIPPRPTAKSNASFGRGNPTSSSTSVKSMLSLSIPRLC